MTIASLGFRHEFTRIAKEHAEEPALIDARNGASWTYADLASLTDRAAAFLSENGARAGKTVVTLLPNSVDTLVLFLGALRLGANIAPLSPEATARDVRNWIQLVDPTLCVFAPSTQAIIDDACVLPGLQKIAIETAGEFNWIEPSNGTLSVSENCDPSRLYLYTSGTTGEPKALAFDSDRLWAASRAFAMHHEFLDSNSRFFNILPMFYLGGLFNLGMIPLCVGGSIVIADAFSGRSYLQFWREVAKFEINVLWLVPTILRGLLRLAEHGAPPKDDLGKRVRGCFLGTAPADLALKERFEETFGIPLLENYGLSETLFITSETASGRAQRSNGSVGEVLPSVQLRCRSDHPDSKDHLPGEIEVKTPFLFLGYLRSDGQLECPITDDGYFATGDLGRVNVQGTLLYEGRTRDIIKKGGHMIILREIEVLAEKHPLIEEASAVPVAHEFYGEDYVLAVRVRSQDGDSIAAFQTWLRDELAQYKWPGKIIRRTEFPRTNSGKIVKRELAEEIHKEHLTRTSSEAPH